IFGSIVSAIFGHSSATGTTAAAGSSAAPASTAAPSAAAGTGKPMTRAEVEVVIKQIADGQREKLNWKESILDLMKLLNLATSLGARKQLAQELGYKAALGSSADMKSSLTLRHINHTARWSG